MIMDSSFGSSIDGYQFSAGVASPSPDDYFNYATFFKDNTSSQPAADHSASSINNPTTTNFNLDAGNFNLSASSDEAGSPDTEDSDDILRYISQVLMEENIDQNPCMFQDSLALQAAEKPFYDALGEKYPPFSPNQHPLNDSFSFGSSSSEERFFGSTSDSTDSSSGGVDDSNWVSSLLVQTPPPPTPPPATDESPVTNFTSMPSFSSSTSSTLLGGSHFVDSNYLGSSSTLSSNIFSDRDSMLLFQKGMEEASKFLPKPANLLDLNLDNLSTFPEKPKEDHHQAVTTPGNYVNYYSPPAAGSRTRKALHYMDNGGDDDQDTQRRSKQAALSVEETDELSELFDKVLLCSKETDCLATNPNPPNPSDLVALTQTRSDQHQSADKNRPHNKQSSNNGSSSSMDLRTMLILCAQAASSDDLRTANELLRQIRQHSSPSGSDGSQRLAHYFSNAIEARLAGSGSQIYTALASRRTSASDAIKAYKLFVSRCPFQRMSIILANKTISKFTENKEKVHIIDIGIRYGFQWPSFIECLSRREGGPPLLKITGIELPQPGFRPSERVEATGNRLTKYCEKFGVKFQYRAIAQKWETVRVEDLGIENDEVVIVNSLFRFRNLLDETIIVKDNPRDAVLRLIKEIKPAVFMHGSVNGSFNAPFFLTRFREALFYYSTLFDMLEVSVNGDEEDETARELYEREFHGREIMNVVACEGTERVERPESYKQWGVRIGRVTGFKQNGFDPVLMETMKEKVKSCYHKDYVVSEDGGWALQGWKGRIVSALSAWVPTE